MPWNPRLGQYKFVGTSQFRRYDHSGHLWRPIHIRIRLAITRPGDGGEQRLRFVSTSSEMALELNTKAPLRLPTPPPIKTWCLLVVIRGWGRQAEGGFRAFVFTFSAFLWGSQSFPIRQADVLEMSRVEDSRTCPPLLLSSVLNVLENFPKP